MPKIKRKVEVEEEEDEEDDDDQFPEDTGEEEDIEDEEEEKPRKMVRKPIKKQPESEEPEHKRRFGIVPAQPTRIVDVEANEVMAEGEYLIAQALADIIERLERIENTIGSMISG